MDIYNTSMSIGLFIGELASVWLYSVQGHTGVYTFTAILIAIWLICVSGMQSFKTVKVYIATPWPHLAEKYNTTGLPLAATRWSVHSSRN